MTLLDRCIYAVLGALATAFCTWCIVSLMPYFMYVINSPSLGAECGKIQPGMEAVEVLVVPEESVPPFDQAYGRDRLVFSRRGASCEVHFEAGSTKVETVHVVSHGMKIVE